MEKVNITHFDNANSTWLNALAFYNEEIGTLKSRLTEIAGKNTDPEVMKQVEHYENQFKVQTDNIDLLLHDIHANDREIREGLLDSKEGYVAKRSLTTHSELGDRFSVEEGIMKDIRQSFMQFAATWM